MVLKPSGRIAFNFAFLVFSVSAFQLSAFQKMDLRPHIDKFARRFTEVEAALSDPKAFDNPQRAQELSKEYARLKDLVAAGQAYLKVSRDLGENRTLLQTEPADSE